jgi:hypothetical protein
MVDPVAGEKLLLVRLASASLGQLLKEKTEIFDNDIYRLVLS